MENWILRKLGVYEVEPTTAIAEAEKVFRGSPAGRHGFVWGWRSQSARVAKIVNAIIDGEKTADAWDAMLCIKAILDESPPPATFDDAQGDGPTPPAGEGET